MDHADQRAFPPASTAQRRKEGGIDDGENPTADKVNYESEDVRPIAVRRQTSPDKEWQA
jgi:hypothetical protein